MSDSKKPPSPPPDDFSKTMPNINLPKGGNSSNNDWDKTNYNYPAQPHNDDWGNTVPNYNLHQDEDDFGKTFLPGSQKNVPQNPDWGVTQHNIDLSETDFGGGNNRNYSGGNSSNNDDSGNNYGATTPYFRLPEAERQKYQNLPPTPTEKAAQEEKEKQEQGGIPGWVWVVAGLMSMFFFAVAILLLVYFFIISDKGFEATVKGAPPGSNVLVNGAFWGVTSEDGSIKLPTLKAGETKKIEIVHPSYTCEAREIKGVDGVKPEPIIARCTQKKVEPGENCGDIKLGEFDKAERCYNAALDGLPDPFTPEDLTKALNILIINFDSGKYDIPPIRLAALQKGATFIKKLPPTVVLEVGGHTDSDGSDASNQTLSENRAKAVKDALIKFGVNASTLETKGYGETKPKTT
ncbi:MAG TPA: OmpA family protein, partial [Pyrinomonadaceae bacterium]|nr:OmpA family protein [Pyrinomonadaceae bacterium]